eukprot:CAMPEP_0173379312 /NCGR_PEP_ID=MMETSP1356-20130122/2311_1 /TAXON_ID=77927 ORGANISM="Hemiselmis virescens, Strain PCC157" /NCGR_SAMPLE_ID=MMETSP1356 /ASSEMBLY_ACC=CAM_ASM_000847 /LENGTH=251 /DNA_ID=CAMNT_0014332627 /DNA_START=54 /DNA_END=809 /DNA_ORIENTATION=-
MSDGHSAKASEASKLIKVSPPHPDWTPPQPQPSPFTGSGFKSLDPASKDTGNLYALCISAVVPRPIAFTSTLSADGVQNLSPFSYFNILSHKPPTVAIGICRKPGGAKKDTIVNIEATGEFVVNIISDWFVEAANHTCGDFPSEDNEMELAGLTPLPSHIVKPPRVAESAFHMECKVKQIIPLEDDGQPTTEIVMGTVVMFHVAEGVYAPTPSGSPAVDNAKFQAVGRMGANDYGRVTELFELARPARPGQ